MAINPPALNLLPVAPGSAAAAALFGAAGPLGVKSETIVLLDNVSSNGLSNQTLDMRAYNAVHVEINVSGTGVSATLTIEGASAPGGPYQVLATSNATMTVAATTAANVPCGALFVKVRLAGITGAFPAGGGITVKVNGYLSGSFTDVTLVGPTITASSNINQINGAAVSAGNPLPVELSDGAAPIGTAGNPLHTATATTIVDGGLVALGTTIDAPWDGVAGGTTLVAAVKALWARLRGGQQTMAQSLPVAIASNQSVVPTTRGYTADTNYAYGTVTSPALGVPIVSLVGLGAGVYEVQAQAGFLGTVAVGDADNMDVRHGPGATVTLGKLPCSPIANTLGPLVVIPRVTLAGVEAITINAPAAGQAGSVYRALLIVTRVA